MVAGIACAAIFVTLFAGLLCFSQLRATLSIATRSRPAVTRGGGAQSGHLFLDHRYFWVPGTSVLAYEEAGGVRDRAAPDTAAVVAARIRALREADPWNKDPLPYDLVAGPGSILDPYIGLAAAQYQVARVARARGLDPKTVGLLLSDAIEEPLFGVFSGPPRVDVLKLNAALDAPSAREG